MEKENWIKRHQELENIINKAGKLYIDLNDIEFFFANGIFFCKIESEERYEMSKKIKNWNSRKHKVNVGKDSLKATDHWCVIEKLLNYWQRLIIKNGNVDIL